MWRRITSLSFLLLFLGTPTWAVDGTFQGRVIDPPVSQPIRHGWIYVQGRNHLLRRVEVSHADIVFGENVPVSHRHKCTVECLTAGLEVRITAEQDNAGEWRAKRVEILKLNSRLI